MGGQGWFSFAWSLQLRASRETDDAPTEQTQEKVFSKSSAGRGLNQVISVAADGTETKHWQCRDPATAWTLARRLAGRLGGVEKVKLRSSIDVVTTIQTEQDVEAWNVERRT